MPPLFRSNPIWSGPSDEVRAVCSTALGLREDHKLRNRLPLSTLAVAGDRAELLVPFAQPIADELNVKAVTTQGDRTAYGPRSSAPTRGSWDPGWVEMCKPCWPAARSGDWHRNDTGEVVVGGHILHDGEYELALDTGEGDSGRADLAAEAIRYVDPEGRMIDTGLVVALDLTVTPELHAEGVTRDLVRLVQQARRDGGLDVTEPDTPENRTARTRASHGEGPRRPPCPERAGHIDHLRQLRRSAGGGLW